MIRSCRNMSCWKLTSSVVVDTSSMRYMTGCARQRSGSSGCTNRQMTSQRLAERRPDQAEPLDERQRLCAILRPHGDRAIPFAGHLQIGAKQAVCRCAEWNFALGIERVPLIEGSLV